MEERIIKVSLEKAREWYNSDNNTLKLLALQAFTKDELEMLTIKDVIKTLLNDNSYNLNTIQRHQLNALVGRSKNEISAPKMLRILAFYFNKDWNKTIGNIGYFIARKAWSGYQCYNNLGEDWTIVKHESVNYPIPYFKNEKDCRKAFTILKDANKLDNLYVDF